MITDAAVFRDEYVPQRILHRDAEQELLAHALQPALVGDRAQDVLIHGPQGTGKSLLARHILQDLAERGDIPYGIVGCMGHLSTASIVRATLEALGTDPAANTPREDLCLALHERVDQPTVVVLDEADDVPETDALARLWDCELLSVVAIVHDETRWLDRLDRERARQWHDGVTLQLDRYAPSELADILGPRARKGLATNVVERPQLEEIADRAAGSARRAIQGLHATADVASECDRDAIADADIADGLDRARRWIRENNIQSLNYHHQVLYELIRASGDLLTGDVHTLYEDHRGDLYAGVAPQPVGERYRREIIEKLIAYDLVNEDGSSRWRTVRAADPTIESPLDIDVSAYCRN
jgi:Cdc6-like AAA superfamily ATPase